MTLTLAVLAAVGALAATLGLLGRWPAGAAAWIVAASVVAGVVVRLCAEDRP